MVLIWRDQEGADPQVFELLVAGVVKRERPADDIAGRITATVGTMTGLGDDDPRRRIAEATDRTAAAVVGIDLPKSSGRKAGEATALGAAGAVGMLGWRAVRELFVR